jgi:hypothetical protein
MAVLTVEIHGVTQTKDGMIVFELDSVLDLVAGFQGSGLPFSDPLWPLGSVIAVRATTAVGASKALQKCKLVANCSKFLDR